MLTSNCKSILLTLLSLLTLTSPQTVSAQQLQAFLSHYSTDNGLCSNSIASIQQDDYGFVWLATWNGVSRFDGYHFYNYKTGNPSGIRGLHNRVEGMVIDHSQNVWMKMYDGRLFVINRQTDCIEDPLKDINGHEDYKTDYFFTPYVTSSNDVLVSFKDVGLYKMRLDRYGLKHDLIMTGKQTVTCIVEGYRGDIWVGTDQGVHRIDMLNLSLEKKGYFLDEYITYLSSNGYTIFAGTRSGKIFRFSYGQEPTLVKDIGREVTGLFVDSHGLIWYSDLGDGTYRLNPETGDSKHFKQRVPLPEFTSRGAEYSEALGTVWVRMNHGGYGYYNRETDEIEYFHNDPINPWNLCNTVNARLEMNDGVVWESTIRRGFEKLELLKNTIPRIQLIPNAESPLENEIRAMYYDNSRHLLLMGNKKGALFLINDDGSRTMLTHDSSGKPFGRFYGITKDSQGNYWLCDKDNGIYKMSPNGSGYTITNYRHDDDDKNSLSSNSAYLATEDYQGNIWVATYGGGVNILVKDGHGGYKVYNRFNVLKRYPTMSHQKVRTIAVDKEGKVWAGTTDGILIMSLQGQKVTIEKLEMPKDVSKGLMSNDIICLARDINGNMWVGTNSGGLSRSTTKDEDGTWQFTNYGIAQGLPSEEICSITFDSKGNVWLAADHVLCSFDVKKEIFSVFSKLEGVDDTMCSEGAAVTLSNGNILFGTLDGYYVVDLSKLITKTGSLLKLRITDFFLNDELQTPHLNHTFDYYVPESKQVELPNHNDQFAFRFASLNYQFQHRIHYQYRLEGYDADWQNAGKDRMAVYEDVPAGTYQFQVKAFLLESPENYDMRTIEVVVPPYFLLSTYAVWIYLVILGIVGIGVLLWYQEKLRKEMQQKDDTSDIDTDEEEKPVTAHEEEVTDAYEIME